MKMRRKECVYCNIDRREGKEEVFRTFSEHLSEDIRIFLDKVSDTMERQNTSTAKFRSRVLLQEPYLQPFFALEVLW
jgi:hypothetical protein